MKTKVCILVAVVAIFANSYFGLSHTLIVNSKVDTLAQMKVASSQNERIKIEEDIQELHIATANYKNIFAKTADSFHAIAEANPRSPLANTLTVGIIPIMLFFIVVYHLIMALVIRRIDQWEHIVNLLLACSAMFALFWLMIAISEVVPTFPEGYVWGNYGFNIFFSMTLYMLAAFLITAISERQSTEAYPQIADDQNDGSVPDDPPVPADPNEE